MLRAVMRKGFVRLLVVALILGLVCAAEDESSAKDVKIGESFLKEPVVGVRTFHTLLHKVCLEAVLWNRNSGWYILQGGEWALLRGRLPASFINGAISRRNAIGWKKRITTKDWELTGKPTTKRSRSIHHLSKPSSCCWHCTLYCIAVLTRNVPR